MSHMKEPCASGHCFHVKFTRSVYAQLLFEQERGESRYGRQREKQILHGISKVTETSRPIRSEIKSFLDGNLVRSHAEGP